MITALIVGAVARLTLLGARKTRAQRDGATAHLVPRRLREPYAVSLRDGSRAWVYPAAWLAQQEAN